MNSDDITVRWNTDYLKIEHNDNRDKLQYVILSCFSSVMFIQWKVISILISRFSPHWDWCSSHSENSGCNCQEAGVTVNGNSESIDSSKTFCGLGLRYHCLVSVVAKKECLNVCGTYICMNGKLDWQLWNGLCNAMCFEIDYFIEETDWHCVM